MNIISEPTYYKFVFLKLFEIGPNEQYGYVYTIYNAYESCLDRRPAVFVYVSQKTDDNQPDEKRSNRTRRFMRFSLPRNSKKR